MRSLLAAIQFLTVIPVRVQLAEPEFARSPRWFPAVGLLLGGIVALGDHAIARLAISPMLLSILSICVLSAASGGLHLDGLADTADGFLSGRPRERVLEIMRDSRIGTMGTLALFFVLAIKVAALADLADAIRWRTLVLAPIAGRCALAVVMGLLPYARKDGLASIFTGPGRGLHSGLAGLAFVAFAMVLFGIAGGAVRCTVVVVVIAVCSFWSLRRIGGFTGDTLGATGEIVETTILLCGCLCIM